MKTLTRLLLTFALLGMADGAFAAGCVKGALVAGAAGHVAGNHGVAGAAAGCAVGHHEANKKAKQEQSNSQ